MGRGIVLGRGRGGGRRCSGVVMFGYGERRFWRDFGIGGWGYDVYEVAFWETRDGIERQASDEALHRAVLLHDAHACIEVETHIQGSSR